MQVGYARVSTQNQSTEAQRDALIGAGCERLFEEIASGSRSDRPVLQEALGFVRPGDVLVCYRLDRVARSLPHLIELMETLNSREIGFRSLSECLDTTTPGGRLVFHVFGAVAQFELDLIRERTKTGLQAARQRGRVGGRPKKMTPQKVDAAQKLLAEGLPSKEVASMFGISVPTLYRWCPAGKR